MYCISFLAIEKKKKNFHTDYITTASDATLIIYNKKYNRNYCLESLLECTYLVTLISSFVTG